jgi:tRNA A37 threonylcarbamoyladenosine modification protein TsaB
LTTIQGVMETLKKAFLNYKSTEEKNKTDLAKALKTRRHQKYAKKFKRDKVDYLKRQKLDSVLYNSNTVVNVSFTLVHIVKTL